MRATRLASRVEGRESVTCKQVDMVHLLVMGALPFETGRAAGSASNIRRPLPVRYPSREAPALVPQREITEEPRV
ncbi:MAG TPA: hypothetical protein VIR34_06235 [Gemmatimonadaceae bacterium]